ncbi:GlcNAc transferase, partial [Escherichia coli]
YFVNSYLKGDKMAKSCDYEAIRVFISVNVGKDTNNAITVNYSDSVCATRHYYSTKIKSGG